MIEAGADPNVAMPQGDSPGVAETPLHWAASSDDVDAVRALLDAGATVDALGGIFGGCTPYVEATIFQKYGAAQLLLDRGAANWLPGAAALGHADMVAGFFDADGNLRDDVGRLPNDDISPTDPVFLDRAFQFACRAGHLEIAKFLLDRGADPAAIAPANTSARDRPRPTSTTRWSAGWTRSSRPDSRAQIVLTPRKGRRFGPAGRNLGRRAIRASSAGT